MPLRTVDFKSTLSANSNTSAKLIRYIGGDERIRTAE
jgi:hypothetical protein